MEHLPEHMGYVMKALGFSGDPRNWVGKTIAAVEFIPMEYGATSNTATLFQFEDGTRGWSAGRGSAEGIITGPRPDELEKSRIVTADEYGRICAMRRSVAERREKDRERQKRAEYERLKRELEGK